MKSLSPVFTGKKDLDRLLQQLVDAANMGLKKGNGTLGRNVSVQELIDTGLVEYKDGNLIGSNQLPVPEKPSGFNGYGSYESVTLLWDAPNYQSKTYTTIYRSETDDFSTASIVGVDQGNQFTDRDVSENVTYYYWIQFVRSGKEGPLSATSGLEIFVPISAEKLLEQLSGEIKSTDLHADLAGDIEGLTNLWSEKVTIGDITAGIGIFNDGQETAVGINAERLFVFNSNDPSQAVLPFFIEGMSTYINTAVIKEASIDSAMIGSVKFSSLEDDQGASVIVGGKLKADFIDVDNLTVGSAATFSGDVTSSSYSVGNFGWSLNQNGDAIFEKITAKGGTFTGEITADKINLESAVVNGQRGDGNIVVSAITMVGDSLFYSGGYSPADLKTEGVSLGDFSLTDSVGTNKNRIVTSGYKHIVVEGWIDATINISNSLISVAVKDDTNTWHYNSSMPFRVNQTGRQLIPVYILVNVFENTGTTGYLEPLLSSINNSLESLSLWLVADQTATVHAGFMRCTYRNA